MTSKIREVYGKETWENVRRDLEIDEYGVNGVLSKRLTLPWERKKDEKGNR